MIAQTYPEKMRDRVSVRDDHIDALTAENKRLREALISCRLMAKARKLKHPNIPWERRFASIERVAMAALAEKGGSRVHSTD